MAGVRTIAEHHHYLEDETVIFRCRICGHVGITFADENCQQCERLIWRFCYIDGSFEDVAEPSESTEAKT